jgi:FtsP/CotA-like multicopper oxidase with cupredoxin domain
MAGLVLGIRTVDRATSKATLPAPARHLRLFVQEAAAVEKRELRVSGYVLQRGTEPARDSVDVPGAPLVLTRGETTAITVINRTSELTTVHWHGMELQSIYDGVAGWSGAQSNLAPLIAPGDSFSVSFTPPRAGTFIYHTHMDESMQLSTGMYGPLLVLEPGQRFDPRTDLIFIAGNAVDGGANVTALNGRRAPAPVTLDSATTYRIRLINILTAAPAELRLLADSAVLTWLPIAKDGADLPAALRVAGPAHVPRIGVGETYDFAWTPARRGDVVLELRLPGENVVVRQPIRVR